VRYTALAIGFLIVVISSYNLPQFAGAQMTERCDEKICQITITKDGFVPKTLVVKIGTTIVWTNTDDGRHTVTSGSPGEIKAPLKSFLLENGDTYEFTFHHSGLYAGSYKYFDQVTQTMRGEIIVEPEEERKETPKPKTIEVDFRDPSSGVKASFPAGTIKSMEINAEFHSLIITVETLQTGGKLEVTLDRNLIDAKTNGNDDRFIVLVDVEEGFYDEISSTATERILQIVVPAKATSIEIIGTHVLTGAISQGRVLVTYQGNSFAVEASLSNGSVKRIDIVPDFTSIILTVETSATEDGELMITLPRALIDSKTGAMDDDFIILVEGDEADYTEHHATDTERVLTIAVPAGTEEIEIVGTNVVPEFPVAMIAIAGMFAAMIAAYRLRARSVEYGNGFV
jgi:plastocyanin